MFAAVVASLEETVAGLGVVLGTVVTASLFGGCRLLSSSVSMGLKHGSSFHLITIKFIEKNSNGLE